MLSTLFRRTLLRTPRFTPTPAPGCFGGVGGAAYPTSGLVPALAAIRYELGQVLDLNLRAPTASELARAIQRARRNLAKSCRQAMARGENFLHSMGNAYETALLGLEFNNTSIATIGDAVGLRGSTTAGSFYVGLHTGDPGENADATFVEATFPGYGRQAVARTAGGWTIAGNAVSNTAAITFGQNTGADQTIGFYSISGGTDGLGAEIIVRYGPLIAAGATWLNFTATVADALTVPGNPFVVDDRVVCAASYDASLPAGVVQGTIYWVKSVAGNDVTLSLTQGGATLDVTAAGSGVCIKAKPLVVRGGIDSVQFAAGTLVSKID